MMLNTKYLPITLVNLARTVMRTDRPDMVGLGPRVAALLGRQAFEFVMHKFWSATAPGVENISMRAQLICLPYYVSSRGANDTRCATDINTDINHDDTNHADDTNHIDPYQFVSNARHTWHVLSSACHHHVYKLPPSVNVLEVWLKNVETLNADVDSLLK